MRCSGRAGGVEVSDGLAEATSASRKVELAREYLRATASRRLRVSRQIQQQVPPLQIYGTTAPLGPSLGGRLKLFRMRRIVHSIARPSNKEMFHA